MQRYFNPRSREGSDTAFVLMDSDSSISIHAPAKGATIQSRLPELVQRDFNPRSREGSDVPQSRSTMTGWVFQSTLPRRERRGTGKWAALQRDFNPRSREGSDRFRRGLAREYTISIHAPAKGATASASENISSLNRFQSTLPRRERLYF